MRRRVKMFFFRACAWGMRVSLVSNEFELQDATHTKLPTSRPSGFMNWHHPAVSHCAWRCWQ